MLVPEGLGEATSVRDGVGVRLGSGTGVAVAVTIGSTVIGVRSGSLVGVVTRRIEATAATEAVARPRPIITAVRTLPR